MQHNTQVIALISYYSNSLSTISSLNRHAYSPMLDFKAIGFLRKLYDATLVFYNASNSQISMNDTAHKKSILTAILISVFLHLCLILQQHQRNHYQSVKSKPPASISLQLKSKRVNHSPSPKQETRTSSVIPKTAAPSPAKTSQQQQLSYSDLLVLPPPESLEEAEPLSAIKNHFRGDVLSLIKANSDDFLFEFDLPLVFRREQTTGLATAQLEILSPNQICIHSLSGVPEIRAALFEALTVPSSFNKLKALFALYQQQTLTLELLYQTRYAPHKTNEFEVDYQVHSDKLTIQFHRNLEIPTYGSGGIAIEDEHSKKAKLRDRRHLTHLRQSIAYQRLIRNWIITSNDSK